MNKKRPFVFLLLIAIAINTVCGQPVKEHGKLATDGIYLVDQDSEPLVLRGVSFGWHNWWPRFYTEGTVKWLADDWSVTVIRAAMGVEPDKGYLNKPEWSQQTIETVIEAAIEHDVYVIFVWHSHWVQLEAARTFFKEMAEKYGQYPHVIYEIFNEPVRDPWEEIKAYSVEIIKTIRETDPDNIIIVGSPHWDQDLHLVADDPIEGYDNLMYGLHFYAATHKKELRDRGDYAMKKGIPLFVSESAGMSSNGDGPIDYKSWHKWIDWMEDNKISWVCWSISDKNETCSMLYPTASSDGNWTSSDLKESGAKTRKLLREFEQKK